MTHEQSLELLSGGATQGAAFDIRSKKRWVSSRGSSWSMWTRVMRSYVFDTVAAGRPWSCSTAIPGPTRPGMVAPLSWRRRLHRCVPGPAWLWRFLAPGGLTKHATYANAQWLAMSCG